MPVKITGISVVGTVKGNVLPLYDPPTVTSVSPSSGSELGGTSITITGTDFINVTGVTVGGAAVASYTVVDSTTITAVTPAGTLGSASVIVTTDYGSNNANTLFEYLPPGDPSWNNVVLLLQDDAANNTSVFVDSSQSAKTATVVGSVVNSTAVTPPFGTSSIRSPGTNAARTYLQYADSSDWFFGTGNVTIEMWIRVHTFNTGENVFFAQMDSAGFAPVRFGVTATTVRARLQPINWSTGALRTTTISTNTWYHVAFVRNGTSAVVYVDGVGGTPLTVGTNSIPDVADPLYVGGVPSNTNNVSTFNGYVKGLRVTKGVARYTGNFTVPTGPFPDY